MPKIAMIGAGSVIFSRNLCGDILSFAELGESEIALMDIDEERLELAEVMAKRAADYVCAAPKIKAYTDRKAALDGADYVINMIQVGGYDPCTIIDFEIPKKYGLRQTIGDTLGIGGIFRALRTAPVLLDICRDIENLCPDAWLLNYVNPMAINTAVILRGFDIKTVGLCHGIQSSVDWLASVLNVPKKELQFLAAGVNHMAFFLTLEHFGVDLYPRLKELAADPDSEFSKRDPVRVEMLRRFGYYGGESSEHTAEYVPYFIRRNNPELIERFRIPLDEYLSSSKEHVEWWKRMRREMMESSEPLEHRRSEEYCSYVIHSIEAGTPRVIYGNVLNNGSVTNLPAGQCVEVPCLVDANGVTPTIVGELPPQVAALIRTQINVQHLIVEAILTGKKEHVYHAAMLDPRTSAELTIDETCALVDDMFQAHGDWLSSINWK